MSDRTPHRTQNLHERGTERLRCAVLGLDSPPSMLTPTLEAQQVTPDSYVLSHSGGLHPGLMLRPNLTYVTSSQFNTRSSDMTQNSTGGQGGNISGSAPKGTQSGSSQNTGTQQGAHQSTQGTHRSGQQGNQGQSGTKPTTPNPVAHPGTTPGRDANQPGKQSDTHSGDQGKKPGSQSGHSPAALPGIEVNPTTPAETSTDSDKAYGPGGGHVVGGLTNKDNTPDIITPQGGTDGIKGAGQSPGQRAGLGADTKPL